jgi:lipopolysaccharide/colanic/teichoic acid biosynthesis glycosyltransferase
MTSLPSNSDVTQRLLTAQTSLGRLRLRSYLQAKRALWHGVVYGTLFIKRTVDIAASTAAIICLSPLLLGVAVLVKLDGGPVLFRQTRIGLMGREIKMLKFRSMCVDAEARLAALLAQNEKSEGVTFKIKHDPRITTLGRILRKTSMDELPQLFNVLRGDMSLVGPRPPIPREVALYSQQDRRRLLVKPGITCLWQIGEKNGGLLEIGDRNSIDFAEQVQLDVRYLESQSVWKDLWILLKTIPAVLAGKGV